MWTWLCLFNFSFHPVSGIFPDLNAYALYFFLAFKSAMNKAFDVYKALLSNAQSILNAYLSCERSAHRSPTRDRMAGKFILNSIIAIVIDDSPNPKQNEVLRPNQTHKHLNVYC